MHSTTQLLYLSIGNVRGVGIGNKIKVESISVNEPKMTHDGRFHTATVHPTHDLHHANLVVAHVPVLFLSLNTF